MRSLRAPRELPSERACPVRLLHRHRPELPGDQRHLGTDFRMCESAAVIAIADGTVVHVEPEREAAADPSYEGGYVIIEHTGSVQHGRVRMWYQHVANIAVVAGDRVGKGDVIAEFWQPEDREWIRHVHLFWSGSRLPVEDQDPLRLTTACRSQARGDEYIYPVEC